LRPLNLAIRQLWWKGQTLPQLCH